MAWFKKAGEPAPKRIVADLKLGDAHSKQNRTVTNQKQRQ